MTAKCPDCKQTAQVKEHRGDKTRYICIHCGRNFTEGKKKLIATAVKSTDEIIEAKPKLTTIQIDENVRQWLESLKIIPKEPINSVLIKLKDSFEKNKAS